MKCKYHPFPPLSSPFPIFPLLLSPLLSSLSSFISSPIYPFSFTTLFSTISLSLSILYSLHYFTFLFSVPVPVTFLFSVLVPVTFLFSVLVPVTFLFSVLVPVTFLFSSSNSMLTLNIKIRVTYLSLQIEESVSLFGSHQSPKLKKSLFVDLLHIDFSHMGKDLFYLIELDTLKSLDIFLGEFDDLLQLDGL